MNQRDGRPRPRTDGCLGMAVDKHALLVCLETGHHGLAVVKAMLFCAWGVSLRSEGSTALPPMCNDALMRGLD